LIGRLVCPTLEKEPRERKGTENREKKRGERGRKIERRKGEKGDGK
jgi:hypothetical protein